MLEIITFVFSDVKNAILFFLTIIAITAIICDSINTCVLYITESSTRQKTYIEKAANQLKSEMHKNEIKQNIVKSVQGFDSHSK